jgi:hypothetical protein
VDHPARRRDGRGLHLAGDVVTEPTVTVHVEGVPVHSITDALLAIEGADLRGMWDQEQHDRLTRLVLGLRQIRDEALDE